MLIKDIYGKFISFNKNFSKVNLSNDSKKIGILYTIYSDKFNLIEVGFAENNHTLDKKLRGSNFILLEKKEGTFKSLYLLKVTLKQLGEELFNDKYFKYSSSIMKHLDLFGWPIGKSLYKRRIIKKQIACSLI